MGDQDESFEASRKVTEVDLICRDSVRMKDSNFAKLDLNVHLSLRMVYIHLTSEDVP